MKNEGIKVRTADIDFKEHPGIAYFHPQNVQALALNLTGFGIQNFYEVGYVKNFELYCHVVSGSIKDDRTQSFAMSYIYDTIRLVTSFENFMKAKLLLSGYVVHSISKDKKYNKLKPAQVTRPILLSELVSIENFNFEDLSRPIMPGINYKTIMMSNMLEEEYQKVIGLPIDVRESIKEYNYERNNLHFYTMAYLDLGPKPMAKLEAVINYVRSKIEPDFASLKASLRDFIKQPGIKWMEAVKKK